MTSKRGTPRLSTQTDLRGLLHVGASLLLAAGLVGCSGRTNQLRIQAFRSEPEPEELFEHFDDAYFSYDALGNLDLVFRSVHPSQQEPSQLIRQVVHVNAFWKPIPGRTFVESSQCNATFCYMIGTGPVCISYEGAGFITFKLDWFKRRLTGRIESGELAPLRRVGKPKDLFGQARITGKFTARRDKAKVFKIVGELRRQLGPMPDYTRPPDERPPR